MDDELKKRLSESAADLIEWVERTGKDGESFVREQAPLLAQEIISWHILSHAILAAVFIGLAIAVVSCSTLVRRVTECLRDSGDRDVIRLIYRIVSIVAALLFVGATFECGFYILQAIVAPRVVILHELQKLL